MTQPVHVFRWQRDEKGSAAVEWALMVPLLILVICLVVAGGRLMWAKQELAAAASAAARAASLQQSSPAAQAAAASYLNSNVNTCTLLESDVRVKDLDAQPGHAGNVVVKVRCRVDLSDLLVPGLPGSITISEQVTETVDRYVRRHP